MRRTERYFITLDNIRTKPMNFYGSGNSKEMKTLITWVITKPFNILAKRVFSDSFIHSLDACCCQQNVFTAWLTDWASFWQTAGRDASRLLPAAAADAWRHAQQIACSRTRFYPSFVSRHYLPLSRRSMGVFLWFVFLCRCLNKVSSLMRRNDSCPAAENVQNSGSVLLFANIMLHRCED